ncbi:hypothetical protein ACFQY4_26725 [Catellatospora bangladeshensis]|uniref:hypothetical protein n=1 Tax=Catellatospora bangladeshensis TaxID=310355 RepID=UPI0036199D80
MGAELVGAIVIFFAVTPIVRRAQQGRVHEHRRLDYDWYTDRVTGARTLVRVLDTFSGLFSRPVDQRFFRAATALLRRRVPIQVLLMDPDSLAAEQRTEELQGTATCAWRSCATSAGSRRTARVWTRSCASTSRSGSTPRRRR